MANFNLSLDEYIRRKKTADSVCLVNMRKKEEFIDKDDLDRSLDDMVREKLEGTQESAASLSKFDRIRINSDRFGEVDEDDDVIMENPSIRFAKEIEKMEHPSCCKSKPFRTIEEKMKVKISSQQWRLNKDGQGNPQQIRRIGGRIQKNYRQNESKFVDRGAFTFKYQNDSDSESSVVGIMRNQPRFQGSQFNHNNEQGPITINMNWRGFFEGASRYNQIMTPPPTPAAPPGTPVSADGMANVNLQFAARDLLEFLDFKKGQQKKPKEEISYAEQYAYEAGINGDSEENYQ